MKLVALERRQSLPGNFLAGSSDEGPAFRVKTDLFFQWLIQQYPGSELGALEPGILPADRGGLKVHGLDHQQNQER